MATLSAGNELNVNGTLESDNQRARLVMQGDGNLVLYRSDNAQALWSSNTNGTPANHAVMQGDGNFVLYDQQGKVHFASNTDGHPGSSITMQDDANLVVYAPAGPGGVAVPLWATHTVVDWSVVTIAPRHHDLGAGHHMVADAELHMDRNLATFHLTETRTNKVAGFTGGVKMFYYDAEGKLLGDSGTQQYGIGQAPLFGAGHRTETWSGATPAGTVALGLATFHDPQNRFPVLEAIGNALGDFFGALADIPGAVLDFCNHNSEACLATLFVLAAGAIVLAGGTVVISAGVDVVLLPAGA